MHTYLMDMLQCPACHGELAWDIADGSQDRVETGSARCTACEATYPVQEGIGVFLAPEQQREGMWEQESRQVRYVREHPEVERQLLESPLESLNPADQFFRAHVLEARGQYAEAKAAWERSQEGLYTAEARAAVETMTTFVGISSIREPGDILAELRRVVSGTLLSISVFYPPDDEIHAPVIRKAGLEKTIFRSSALEAFAAAGWQVEVVNARTATVRLTPKGVLLEGFQVDGFPLAETTQESCVLIAR